MHKGNPFTYHYSSNRGQRSPMTPGQRKSQGRKRVARDRKAMGIAAEALRTGATRAQVVQRRQEKVEAIRANSRRQAEARKHTPVEEGRFPRDGFYDYFRAR